MIFVMPKLKTKKDLLAYIADLEIELCYEQRERNRLQADYDDAIELIRDLMEGDLVVTYELETFSIPNPGTIN